MNDSAESGTSYRHTQVGQFVFLLNGSLALLFAVQLARGGSRALLIPLAVVIIVSMLFGIMTVEVEGRELRFRFGPGGWGKRVPLDQVDTASPTRTAWWEGIGIRATRRGMLYNVAPGRAVEVVLRGGRAFRIGSDEPEKLAAAILAARDARGSDRAS